MDMQKKILNIVVIAVGILLIVIMAIMPAPAMLMKLLIIFLCSIIVGSRVYHMTRSRL